MIIRILRIYIVAEDFWRSTVGEVHDTIFHTMTKNQCVTISMAQSQYEFSMKSLQLKARVAIFRKMAEIDQFSIFTNFPPNM